MLKLLKRLILIATLLVIGTVTFAPYLPFMQPTLIQQLDDQIAVFRQAAAENIALAAKIKASTPTTIQLAVDEATGLWNGMYLRHWIILVVLLIVAAVMTVGVVLITDRLLKASLLRAQKQLEAAESECEQLKKERSSLVRKFKPDKGVA